jgi:hypothetical protein
MVLIDENGCPMVDKGLALEHSLIGDIARVCTVKFDCRKIHVAIKTLHYYV